MKKDYITPQVIIIALTPHRLLTGSNKMQMTITGGSSVPSAVLDFGGVDEDGDKEGE